MLQLTEDLYEKIASYIRVNVGLNFPPEKQADLEYGLLNAAQEYHVSDLPAFVIVVLNRPMTLELKQTLQKHLTIGETYFFRERPVIDRFKSLLMRLASERRKSTKSLKIWSAGCSTGEEPYTLAMVVAEAIPDFASWDISLLGTDINANSLEKARKGIYRPWSFRGVEKHLIDKYFTKYSDTEFQLRDLIRNLVQLNYLNLFEESYPSPITKTTGLDFIFCRNVIMYFDENGRKRVLQGFYNALANNGHLFLSLTELAHQAEKRFITHKEGSVIYFQKSLGLPANEPPAITPAPLVTETLPRQIIQRVQAAPGNLPDGRTDTPEYALQLFEQIEVLYNAAEYTTVIKLYEQKARVNTFDSLSDVQRETVMEYFLKSYANTGRLTEAELLGRTAVIKLKTSPRLHVFYANILQEQGKMAEAVSSLQKALYLDPDYVPAYFTLANLYRRMHRPRESKKTFETTASILQKMDALASFPDLENISAAELLTIIEKAMENL
ncbi:MAG: tetratricopeptide repeat protein [Ignavibacteria bacterium]|nr:tetratricopeptide repeat protein [Ignavibacteria bacterium]